MDGRSGDNGVDREGDQDDPSGMAAPTAMVVRCRRCGRLLSAKGGCPLCSEARNMMVVAGVIELIIGLTQIINQLRFIEIYGGAGNDIPTGYWAGVVLGLVLGLLFLCAGVAALVVPKKLLTMHVALATAFSILLVFSLIGTTTLVFARKLPAYILLVGMLYFGGSVAVAILASKSRTRVIENSVISLDE